MSTHKSAKQVFDQVCNAIQAVADAKHKLNLAEVEVASLLSQMAASENPETKTAARAMQRLFHGRDTRNSFELTRVCDNIYNVAQFLYDEERQG